MTTRASASRIAETSCIENHRTLRALSRTTRRVLGEIVTMVAPARAAFVVQKAEAKAQKIRKKNRSKHRSGSRVSRAVVVDDDDDWSTPSAGWDWAWDTEETAHEAALFHTPRPLVRRVVRKPMRPRPGGKPRTAVHRPSKKQVDLDALVRLAQTACTKRGDSCLWHGPLRSVVEGIFNRLRGSAEGKLKASQTKTFWCSCDVASPPALEVFGTAAGSLERWRKAVDMKTVARKS